MVAATGVAVFGLAMAVVTTVELIGHKPVSALVGGSDRSGGTTLGSLTDATGGDGRQQQAPASPSTTPTDGTAPASDSPPTPTSGAESTAPSAPTTSAPHNAPAPPTAPAEELPATPAPEQSASAPSQAGSTAEPGQPSSGVDSSP
jgi:hypothetical protein